MFDDSGGRGVERLVWNHCRTVNRAGKIKSGTPVKVKTIRDWKSLMPALKLSAKEDDLILLLSARRARTAWQPSLVRLPGDISLTFPECNFITIYPSDNTADNEGESDELEDKMKLPPCLAPERVLPELNGVATAEAIKRLLATMFADNPDSGSAFFDVEPEQPCGAGARNGFTAYAC